MIGRVEIARLSRAGHVDERTQERDYVLAWLLAAASTKGFDLVLKGGTCLRRCYVPGYRYSEDLDFTLAPAAERTTLVDAVAWWCHVDRCGGRDPCRRRGRRTCPDHTSVGFVHRAPRRAA